MKCIFHIKLQWSIISKEQQQQKNNGSTCKKKKKKSPMMEQLEIWILWRSLRRVSASDPHQSEHTRQGPGQHDRHGMMGSLGSLCWDFTSQLRYPRQHAGGLENYYRAIFQFSHSFTGPSRQMTKWLRIVSQSPTEKHIEGCSFPWSIFWVRQNCCYVAPFFKENALKFCFLWAWFLSHTGFLNVKEEQAASYLSIITT